MKKNHFVNKGFVVKITSDAKYHYFIKIMLWTKLVIIHNFIISGKGLLVAGGSQVQYRPMDVMELFNPINKTSCVVTAKLDHTRDRHTGDGNLVCGGWTDSDSISSCYNVATGDTINLLNGRNSHTSWSTDAGVYLLGGSGGTGSTTELVTGDTTQAGFGLKYDTR